MEFKIPFNARAHAYTKEEEDSVLEAMRNANPLTQGKYLQEFEEKLRPDFVVVDGVLGCSDVPDDQYDDFMMVLKSNCKLQDQIDSKIYTPQLLYKCTS